HETIHHVLIFPALICPPVGFFWPTQTTFSEFEASINALSGTAYRPFLTVLEVCRSVIEPWFDNVNASPKDFCFRMQSAQPLMNAMPTKENPHPDGVEDKSLLDPILELVDQLLWCYYEDRVLTDCESKETSTNASSQLHHLITHGRECFSEALKSEYGNRVPFLTYFLRPSMGWLMGVDHGAFFSDAHHLAQWIQRYHPVKVPVIENSSYAPTKIQTKLELAVGKATVAKDDAVNSNTAEIVPVSSASTDQQKHEEEQVMPPAIIIRNMYPKDDLGNLSRRIVNGIERLHSEEAEVVSCYFISKGEDTANVCLEFKKIRHARMALSLDGMRHAGSRIISVQLMQPGEIIATAQIPKEKADALEKPSTGLANSAYKRELCQRHASGYCWLGSKCEFAHGVLDLQLNYQTHLHPERCLYIRNIPPNYPKGSLMGFIRNRVKPNVHSSLEVTAIHVRKRMCDAVVEFQEKTHASAARQILDGISVAFFRLEIYPWEPQYQNAFVLYFKEGRDISIDIGISQAPKSAASGGTTIACLAGEAHDNILKQEKLRLRLIHAKREIKDLQEEKGQQDEVLQLLETSLQSMQLGLSTALSEIDTVMQQMVDIQQQVHASFPSQTSSESHSSSSHATATIKSEVERLQKLLQSSNVSDEMIRQVSLLSDLQ
ncbi:MAG: hypothetical protein SGBAC_012815, partial [Bacillariaceae sp.]